MLAPFKASWERYQAVRLGLNRQGKPVCLMDIATIAGRELKRTGKLDDMEDSEEVNAASIVVPVEIDGRVQEWLVMFKNETHNHPTEIEPFGGAATCLGGCIRDPLSGRSYVYQSSESQQDAAINNSWIESSRSIDSPDSIVALTLQPLYQFSNTTTEVLYHLKM